MITDSNAEGESNYSKNDQLKEDQDKTSNANNNSSSACNKLSFALLFISFIILMTLTYHYFKEHKSTVIEQESESSEETPIHVPKFTVWVNVIDDTHAIDVPRDGTVDSLQIAAQQSFQQTLILSYQGQILNNEEETLANLGIGPEAVIHGTVAVELVFKQCIEGHIIKHKVETGEDIMQWIQQHLLRREASAFWQSDRISITDTGHLEGFTNGGNQLFWDTGDVVKVQLVNAGYDTQFINPDLGFKRIGQGEKGVFKSSQGKQTKITINEYRDHHKYEAVIPLGFELYVENPMPQN